MKIKGSTAESKALELKNFIPRGAVVKNSKDVYACIVYTGAETKLALNLGKYQFKISELQKNINKYVGVNIIALVIMDLICSQIFFRIWHSFSIENPLTIELEENHYYIFPASDTSYD